MILDNVDTDEKFIDRLRKKPLLDKYLKYVLDLLKISN